ncbi:MAG: NUDIX hydrolase [Candidatus Magasanikbacteria bacterium]
MIYQEQPEDFNPKFEVVSCFVDYEGKILLLHRQDHKPEGNTWGVPAGKVDEGEKILDTIVREIREETGLEIPSSKISYFGKVYVKFPNYDFVYHMFDTKLTIKPQITINNTEHKDYKWISISEALEMPLIQDLDDCIKLFYKI